MFVGDIATGSVISDLMQKIDQLNETLTERIDKMQGAYFVSLNALNFLPLITRYF